MRTMKLKFTGSGATTLAHPLARPGCSADGRVRIFEVSDVPSSVSNADLVRLWSYTTNLTERHSFRYEELGYGRIIR